MGFGFGLGFGFGFGFGLRFGLGFGFGLVLHRRVGLLRVRLHLLQDGAHLRVAQDLLHLGVGHRALLALGVGLAAMVGLLARVRVTG